MNYSINPFERGYQGFRVERMALIFTHDLTDQWCRIPIHSSQAGFDNNVFEEKKAIFSEKYALMDINSIPEELRSECPFRGHINAVSYRVTVTYSGGEETVVNDVLTATDATRVIEDFQRENSTFGRCWEISNRHLPEEVMDDLIENTILEPPMSFAPLLIDLFLLPDYFSGGPTGLGVRLKSTPWTDKNLLKLTGIDREGLRQKYLDHKVPQAFMDIVLLAGEADTNILIFDAHANALKDLPTYDDK